MADPRVLHDPGMASVEVRGAGAERFLQAQLTSNLATLASGEVTLSAWCTPRGQVRNLFWLVRRPDGPRFSLVAPAGEAEGLAKGLRGFVLRARVEVERPEDRVTGAAGPGSETFVSSRVGDVPAPGAAIESDGRLALRPPGLPDRFLLLGPEAPPPPAPAPTSDDEWRRLEIEAGIAWLTDETRESFIPQMLDLDRLGALSFEKGCFPGQEIIARTRYLGRLKRRLHRGWLPAGERPMPGDPVQSEGRIAGTIVAAGQDAAGGGYELLAVVADDAAGGPLASRDNRRISLSRREG